MKRTVALLLCVVMLALCVCPAGLYAAKGETPVGWRLVTGKYSTSTNKLISREGNPGYSFAENKDGGISVTCPSYDDYPGRHATAALCSTETTALDGLSVDFRTDNFIFNSRDSQNPSADNINGSSVTFAWTTEPLTALPGHTDEICTNGLRGYPAGGRGLYVVMVCPSAEGGSARTDYVYLIYDDGSYVTPTDHRPGKRWVYYAGKYTIDVSQGISIQIDRNETQGYVVLVNGDKLLEADAHTEDTGIPMDFSDLVGLQGYVSFAVCGGYDKGDGADFTVDMINGDNAADASFHDHVPAAEWTVIKQPICTEQGERAKLCTICKTPVKREKIAVIPHSPGEWTYPAGSSCSDEGRILVRTCTMCGKVTEQKSAAASEHVSSGVWSTLVPATLDAPGREAVMCANCDTPLEERETAQLTWSKTFDDVRSGAWYAHAVDYACALGLFSGTSGSTFSPSDTMTRAMLVTVLGKLRGVDTSQWGGTVFDDVPAGKWYSPYAAWAAAQGIAVGAGSLFMPENGVTREQAAVMLYKLTLSLSLGSEPDEGVFAAFNDRIDISSWARPAMAWAVGEGLFAGSGGALMPRGLLTRAQCAQLLTAYLKNIYIKGMTKQVKYISSQRQLFTDNYIVNTDKTTAQTQLFTPVKREVAFRFDAPWEEKDVVYHNIVKMPDGGYRMYYKALDPTSGSNMRRICYIESADGLTWTRPQLTTTLVGDAQYTNIVTSLGSSPDNLYVFWDTNPACPENERLKGVYGQWGDALFYVPSNGDGSFFDFNNTTKMMTKAETGCFFDTLNTVYWDDARGKYVAFVRGFHNETSESPADPDAPDTIRDIRYSESEDFIHWSMPVRLTYNDDYDYQVYANAITPYCRAPQIYVGLPTRYIARDWSSAFDDLCGAEDRRGRGRGTSLNDTIFMSSRGLCDWYRYSEAVLTSGPEQEENWVYGDCYPCVGFIETPSAVPGTSSELSFFMKEKEEGGCYVLYRYTVRLDGFVCRRGCFEGDTLVTQPFTFDGGELELNFASSAVGHVRVSITDGEGHTIHSEPFFGDDTARTVTFVDGSPADFKSKTVTMTFELCDAKIYSFKFN